MITHDSAASHAHFQNEPAIISKRITAELLPYVERPMRYVGNELNMIRKDLSAISLHGVLCFPDIYDIGMSHYGLQVLYHIVNRNPAWALSRCFHPWPDAEKILRERSIPLYSLEYGTSLAQADWVGFSVQYELQYTNVVNMLYLAGIPVWARDRTGTWPLVIAGGPCMINPEPIADFIDAAVIGDGEQVLEQICTLLEQEKRSGNGKPAILEKLGNIPGVYVPSLYAVQRQGRFIAPVAGGRPPVMAAKIRELREADIPDKPLVPLIDVVHHRLAVEVMRGCTRGCRFCAAGMYYRPVRERDASDIFAQLACGVKATGWRDVGLLSLSTADYSHLGDLLQESRSLKEREHVNISLPSTRIDALSNEQLDQINAISQTSSMTIAPEAGSHRLRMVINKDFTDETILGAVETLLKRGVQTVKLYFMVGLPTETDEDLNALIELLFRVSDLAKRAGPRRTVNVSISPFSPKPNTPFQWEGMIPAQELTDRGHRIKSRLSSRKNINISYRDGRITRLETVMARGDRSVSRLIHAAWELGARLDGWDEFFDMSRWEKAAGELGVDMDCFCGAIPLDQPLPWSAFSIGVSDEFMLAERERAYKGLSTPDCRTGGCGACGVCTVAPSLYSDAPSHREAAIPAEKPVPRHAPSSRFFHRATYRKGDAVRFLGHRDMVDIIERAFLAAQVPLEYSQGFKAHARIAFGPPLPLGVAGDEEMLDFITTEPLSFDLTIINRWLPAGLELLRVTDHAVKQASLSAEITAGMYRYVLPSDLRGTGAIGTVIAGFKERQSVVVSYAKEGKEFSKEIRPLVYSVETGADGDDCFTAHLAASQSATCPPALLALALFPQRRFYEFMVTRTGCLKTTANGFVPLS